MEPVLPRILLLGKRGSLVLWLENLARACGKLGHSTKIFAVNGDSWYSRLRTKWEGRQAATADWMLRRFQNTLDNFRPQLVIVAGVFGVPLEYYQILHASKPQPWIAGMVGDRFAAESRAQADACDYLYFSDTRFLHDAQQAQFNTPGCYLPLAVDPDIFRPGYMVRSPELLFVASHTAHRESVVRSLDEPALIIGTYWGELVDVGFHRVMNYKISRRVLIGLYQEHQAVLNVRNEANVEHGLNQRSFEAPACGAVVLNDDLADLPLCFEPEREILVYRDSAELNALVSRLHREPAFAMKIAEAGRKRVLAEHTYAHRVQTILRDGGF